MKKYFQLYSTPKTPEAVPEVFIKPSPRLIQTLTNCVKMENNHPGKSYGPADIGGSFLLLYKRGLVDIKTNSGNNLEPGSWYVTEKGLELFVAISSQQIGSD